MGVELRELSSGDTTDHALGVLDAGGVIVLPTDTLYGFSAAVDAGDAVKRIDALKGISSQRPYVLLADSTAMVTQWVSSFGCTSQRALDTIWPAPLTAVLPAGNRCPGWLRPTAAFRVPDHDVLRELICRLGRPIVSTSVNRRGETPLDDANVIARRFGTGLDLVVSDGTRVSRNSRGSTVVDFCGAAPRVLREGDYAWTGAGKPSK